MAEEFSDFMKELNKKSLKEQVAELQNVVGTLVNITETFISYYDMEFNKLNNKIIKIETEQMRGKLPKIEVIGIPPPPPPPSKRPVGDQNVRKDILAEIKGLFKKNGEGGK